MQPSLLAHQGYSQGPMHSSAASKNTTREIALEYASE